MLIKTEFSGDEPTVPDIITDDDKSDIESCFKDTDSSISGNQEVYDLILPNDSKEGVTNDSNLLQVEPKPWNKQKARGHQKQGSDCTLIDGLQQELEMSKNSATSAQLEPHIQDVLEEPPTDPDKLKVDSNPLTNLVSFIRVNSRRFKRTLNKDVSKDDIKAEELPLTEDKDNEVLPPNIEKIISGQKTIQKHVHSYSYSEFEEIYRSAHGLLRKSDPGPITFHGNTGSPNKFSASRKIGLNNTFPTRSRPKIETADSGFESCTSSTAIVQSTKRKKCAVPQTLYHNISQPSEYEQFQFREESSPVNEFACEAMLPALTDVSDDECTEKPELFFGKFPCRPKIPLKTVKDLYQTQTQSMDFSDSDDEPFPSTSQCVTQCNFPGITSRSSSSGSSISKGDVKRILAEWTQTTQSDSDDSKDLVISPCPGDYEGLEQLFSEGAETVEMVCDGGSENKILTGRIVLWTPDYKQKIKKVFISRQKAGSSIPENSIKIMKNNYGNWSICTTPRMSEISETTIFLTVETDTERSESISTTATSPIYEDEYCEENFDTDEELYFNMREQMRNLDQDIDNTPNQDDLPCSVIDYMNRD